MTDINEDDKPTVVLDLNSLKKQKLKQEEEINNSASELEFLVSSNEAEELNFSAPEQKKVSLKVILFDYQSSFFEENKILLPAEHDYKLIKELPDLNSCLKQKTLQIVALNYDSNPKAVNQLCAQIKAKFPHIKTLIIAKSISPEKAALHAKSPSGANGYLKLPINALDFENEILRIFAESEKAA